MHTGDVERIPSGTASGSPQQAPWTSSAPVDISDLLIEVAYHLKDGFTLELDSP